MLEKIGQWLRDTAINSTGTVNPVTAEDIGWIDEFITNIRPYVFVRTEDNILIKRPNQAQKLNPSGARILKALLDGQSIHELLNQYGRDAVRTQEIIQFIATVKLSLENKLDEFNLSPALEVQPFEMKFSELPILSEVALTYRCNLKCQFCYAGCNCTTNPVGSDREMSGEEIKQVLATIFRRAKVPSVSFTGGEPTLHPQLPEFVAYAKSLGLRVNLISNGTRINAELARRLADAGLDSAQISLEGVTAAVHDQVTAVKHSFPKTVAAVQHLKDAGIRTHTNTTINRVNLMECREMPRFVKEVLGNERFSMNLIIPTGSAALNELLIVRYHELGTHLEAIQEASQRQGVEFMWYSPTPMCMFNPVSHGFGNKGCSACDGLLSVCANGDVIPCASYDESVGNLLREDFGDIWQSQRARQFRTKFWAHSKCQNCDQLPICHGGCPLYWRQMGYGELDK